MKNRAFCSSLLACLCLIGLFTTVPAPCAAEDTAGGPELEALFGEILGPSHEAPVFTDLGGGFYSLSIALSPEAREGLLAPLRSGDPDEKAVQTFFVISAGQAPTTPPNPIATTHGALSDTTFPYTYWIIVLNLGNQNVTRTTTAKLTGPGLKFNRSVQATYNAGGIWVIGFRPGVGAGAPGVYTFQATVAGAGSLTTRSFAVRP